MKIERFEDIEAWQLARKLTQQVYKLTKKPDFSKDYGLKKQIQDAAGSSMHNIAGSAP
jgi:four helix bundle protein